MSQTLHVISRRWAVALAIAALVAAIKAAPAAGQQPAPTRGEAVERRVIEPDGFRWGDAAIGLLAGIGVTSLLAGVIVVITTGRTPRRSRRRGALAPAAADLHAISTSLRERGAEGDRSREPG